MLKIRNLFGKFRNIADAVLENEIALKERNSMRKRILTLLLMVMIFGLACGGDKKEDADKKMINQ